LYLMNDTQTEYLNIQREDTGEHEVTLTITVDAPEMANRLDTAFREYQKRAKLNGFRPGKVPLKLVIQRFGNAIRAQVIEDTIDETYQEALSREHLHPVAPGNIKDIKFDGDSPLVYKAVVATTPEFELANLQDLTVEKEAVAVRNEDIEQTLEEIREDAGTLAPMEGEAVDGTIVESDIQELDPNGVPLIGKSWKDVRIEIGKSPFGPDFDKQLLGIKTGDQRDVKMHREAPDAQTGRHEDVRYRITAKALKSKDLPELTDEFAKNIDNNVESVDELKDNIRKYWEGRTSKEATDRFYNRLVDAVIKAHNFNLPKSMIDDYLDRLVASAKKREGKQEFNEEEFRQQHRANAIWNLKWMLIRHKIADQQELNATDQDVEDAIKRAVEAGSDEERIRMTYKVPEKRQELISDLTERKVLEWLETQAKVKERKVDTDDFYGRKSIVMPK
jgi:trigger factor